MDNEAVLLGILVTVHVLVTLEGILRVTHFVQRSERLALDTGLETR